MTTTVPGPTPTPSEVGPAHHPLSLNQEFLRSFDLGDDDGAFGPHHVLAGAWRLTGPVDPAVLAAALRDVVDRHEVLRTVVGRGPGGATQVVHAATDPELEVRRLAAADRSRDEVAEELLAEVDAAPFPVAVLPHVRAVLGVFDDADAVLVITTHHTATDGWSLGLIAADLFACYAARTGGPTPPEAPRQYGEFAAEQQDVASHPAVASALEYWTGVLAGGRIVAVPADRPRAPGQRSAYGVQRFVLGTELTAAVTGLARSARSTPFMVLLAAYAELLRSTSGAADVVVPTFTSGRYDQSFADTVGPFFNMCPLRVDTGAATTFRDLVLAARATCLGAFAHEVPFALIAGLEPRLTEAFGDPDGGVVAFEVLQSPGSDAQVEGGPHVSELRRRTRPQQASSGIPNGLLWALDVLPTGEIAGSLKYDANHFDAATTARLVDGFRAVLTRGTADPDAPLPR